MLGQEKSEGPIARVGVYWNETSILGSLATMKTEKAMDFLPTLRQDDRLDLVMQETELEAVDAVEAVGPGPKTALEDEVENTEIDEEVEVAPSPEVVTDETLNKETDTEETEVPVLKGVNNVVCISGSTLNVRDESLDNVLFTARKGEKIKVFQGWGDNEKETVIGGKTHKFVRVEFAEREESDQVIGWVSDEFINTEEECAYTNGSVIERDSSTTISGIDDPKCCEFPTVKKVTHSFTSGMRRFKAGRSGGKRLHAACDLYRYKDEPIMAVAPGSVVRDRYYFYQGTYALEVRHSGGFVVRYGELTGKNVSGVSKGRSVKMGDRLGYIGVVNSGCCRPMLHFELYSGKKSGSLSQPKANRFQRRSDLMDPTPYLLKWQSEKF